MSTTPYRVHLLAYTLGNPLDDKTDIAFWGVHAFVLDKLCEGVEEKVDMSWCPPPNIVYTFSRTRWGILCITSLIWGFYRDSQWYMIEYDYLPGFNTPSRVHLLMYLFGMFLLLIPLYPTFVFNVIHLLMYPASCTWFYGDQLNSPSYVHFLVYLT